MNDARASCAPAAATLEVRAVRNVFDRKCLAAPADQSLAITFDNRDSAEPHNIAIFVDDPMKVPNAKVLFRGEQFRGPKIMTYRVDALAAGDYHFHCDVHPTAMFGAFKVD